jgi:hypothetical protein
VLNFLEEQNSDKKYQIDALDQNKPKLNSTVGYSLQGNQLYNGFLRGKSVNYNQKTNPLGNTIGYAGKGQSGQNRLSSVSNSRTGAATLNRPKNLNQLNNQFLTFKLEAPKIITIKK